VFLLPLLGSELPLSSPWSVTVPYCSPNTYTDKHVTLVRSKLWTGSPPTVSIMQKGLVFWFV